MKQTIRKWLIVLLAVVSTICLAFGIAACDKDDVDDILDNIGGNNTITLSAPVIKLTGNVISWDAVENAARYLVYEGDEQVDNISGTSYTINKTEPGEYAFAVAAYNSSADPRTGPKSNTVIYTVADSSIITLDAPVIKLTGNVISWNAVANATHYYVYEDNAETGIKVENTSYPINKTVEGTYKYKVTAYNENAQPPESEKSNEVSYTYTAPTEKITLSAPHITLNDKVISWSAVENATGYYVYEGDATEGEFVSGTSYTIEKTVPGSYVYTVTAYNVAADPQQSEKSNSVTYTKEVPRIQAPTVELQGNALNWMPVLGANGYEIYKDGAKIGEVSSFEFLEDTLYPTTYTVTASGVYTVVTISGVDGLENSLPSEEQTYKLPSTTLSKKNPVHITDATTEITVNAGAYEVVIYPNNMVIPTEFGTGLNVSSIKVYGDSVNHDDPYGAEAVWDVEIGAFTAVILVSGAGASKLYIEIANLYKGDVVLGFTVSLDDPYGQGTDSSGQTITNTYELGITGAVEVDLPYSVGYRIQVNLVGDGFDGSKLVLYITLEDGSTNHVIHLNAGNQSLLPVAMTGYYQSPAFSSKVIYLSSDVISLKATLSFEPPQAYYDSAESLTVEDSLTNRLISGSKASPTLFKVDEVEEGEYQLLINSVEGLSIYAKLDTDADYTKMSASGSVYSLDLSFTSETQYLYLYSTEPDGVNAFSIALNDLNAQKEYTLSENQPVEDAYLGTSAKPTIFNVEGVEEGDYTLTVTGAYDIKVYVKISGETIQLDYVQYGNRHEKIITISEGVSSIEIYTDQDTYISTVSIVKYVVLPNPELSVGEENAVTLDLVADGTEYTFELVDVEPGTYSLKFETESYVFWHNWKAEVGEKEYYFGTLDGFNGDWKNSGSIEIEIPEGCTEIVIYGTQRSSDQGSVTVSLLVPSGEGETSLNKQVTIKYNEYAEIDISKLVAGKYKVELNNGDDFKATSYNFELFFELGGPVVTIEGKGVPYPSGEITIAEGAKVLYVRLAGSSSNESGKVTVNLELIGGGDVGGGDEDLEGGGDKTELVFEFDEDSNPLDSMRYTLDVSELKYGHYTVTFTDFAQTYWTYTLIMDDDSEIEFNEGNNWTNTVTIKSGTITLFTSAYWNAVTITFVLEGGGDVGGGGSVAGDSYDNPIECDNYTGTFTSDLQEAWFRIPATTFVNMGTSFTITFDLGFTVEIDGGYFKTPLTSGGLVELDWMNPTIIHVIAPAGMSISFTISEGGAGGEDEEGTLGTTRSVTVDIPAGSDSVTVILGGTVSDAKSYMIRVSGDIGDDVTVWVFGSSWAAEQVGEEGDYAMATLVSAFDFGAQVEGLFFSIFIKASSPLTNITITLEEV